MPTYFSPIRLPDKDGSEDYQLKGKRKEMQARHSETVLVREKNLLEMGKVRIDFKDNSNYYFQQPTEFNEEYKEERRSYEDITELHRSGLGGVRIKLKKPSE
ncbi:hypothetical protein KW787_02835 [Candidatus Pacearchaeota archaeon]|nr:hypothetical protein [Candidatus Pacearchaeota archaeon]